jgi:hypothetical protein
MQAKGENSMTNPQKYHNPPHYRIKLQGHLDQKWSDWFEHMAMYTEGDQTILTGSLSDQAALHGLLVRIRDLNLTLLSVKRIEPVQQKNQYVP